MKYIVLMYEAEGAWPPEDRGPAIDDSVAACHELNESGGYVAAAPLHPPSTATCVRVRDGKRIVSDGPYAETKEYLGGFFVIDVEDLDRAIEFAARVPGSHRGTAEIRPLIEVPTLPDVSSG